MIRSPREPVREVPQVRLQVCSRAGPRLAIDARGRLPVEPVVRLLEPIEVLDMGPPHGQRHRAILSRRRTYPVTCTCQGTPALRPDPVLRNRLALGQLPSLLDFHRVFWTLPVVRSPPWSSGVVRHPASVHHGRAPYGCTVRTWLRCSRSDTGPPGSRAAGVCACQGSSTPPGLPSPHRTGLDRVAFRV